MLRLWRRRTPMEKGRRAIKSARRYSEWLKKRPFSDQYDGDGRFNDAAQNEGNGSYLRGR